MTIISNSKKGRLIGYARVSTDKQTTDQQVDELKRAGCKKVFIDDGISANAKIRPGLDAAKMTLRDGDIFVVWAIDRAFRSTLDAIIFLDSINISGIIFRSLTQNIDTSTPEGRKWFIDTASWAEYERAMISRRTKAKLAEARRRGVVLGRPYSLKYEAACKAHDKIANQGETLSSVAKQMQVHPITLSRAFKRFELNIN